MVPEDEEGRSSNAGIPKGNRSVSGAGDDSIWTPIMTLSYPAA